MEELSNISNYISRTSLPFPPRLQELEERLKFELLSSNAAMEASQTPWGAHQQPPAPTWIPWHGSKPFPQGGAAEGHGSSALGEGVHPPLNNILNNREANNPNTVDAHLNQRHSDAAGKGKRCELVDSDRKLTSGNSVRTGEMMLSQDNLASHDIPP
eukprot:jgi/Chlat1/1200/Chrsp115S01656